MLWKTCPTQFRNSLGWISWWRQLSNPIYFLDNHSILVKYGEIVSNRLHFLPFAHLIGILAYYIRFQTSDALERDKDPCLSQNEVGGGGQMWDSICSVWHLSICVGYLFIKVQGALYNLFFRKGYLTWLDRPFLFFDWGQWNLTVLFSNANCWSCQYPWKTLSK